MKNGSALVDKELAAVLQRSAFKKAYFRAGVLCAVLLAGTVAFSIALAVSTGKLICIDTPIFGVAVVSLVLFLLSLVYLVVVAALERRSYGLVSAEGRVASSTLVKEGHMHLRVTRQGNRGGYGPFQVKLVYLSTLALLVALGSLGTIVGQVSTTAESSLTVGSVIVGGSPVGIIFLASAGVFLVGFLGLFIARMFTEEGISNVRVFVFPECAVRPRRANDAPTGGVVDDAASNVAEGNKSAVTDVSGSVQANRIWDDGFRGDESISTGVCVADMLLSASYVSSMIEENKHSSRSTVVECIVSTEALNACVPAGVRVGQHCPR